MEKFSLFLHVREQCIPNPTKKREWRKNANSQTLGKRYNGNSHHFFSTFSDALRNVNKCKYKIRFACKSRTSFNWEYEEFGSSADVA